MPPHERPSTENAVDCGRTSGTGAAVAVETPTARKSSAHTRALSVVLRLIFGSSRIVDGKIAAAQREYYASCAAVVQFGLTLSAQSCRRSENHGVAAPTSTTA